MLINALVLIIIIFLLLRASGILWFYQEFHPLIRLAVALLYLPLFFVTFQWGIEIVLAGFSALGLVIEIWWLQLKPSMSRQWTKDQEKMPKVEFNGDIVTVSNLRNATYQTVKDYDVLWYQDQFDVKQLTTIDYAVEPFGKWRGMAHTLVSFGFSDGRFIVFSVEIRKQQGNRFLPVAGMFKRYELMYVIGKEEDLIGLRTNLRHDPVYLFPMKASKEDIQAMFIDMMKRAEKLRVQPEFYHTITNTCLSNIVSHVNKLRKRPIRQYDYRVMFPGYSDDLALELQMVDYEGSLEDARERYYINSRSQFGSEQWSRQIRELQ